MNKDLDLSQCDREPVAFIGQIQPHGAMVITELSTGKAIARSLNAIDFLGTDPLGKYRDDIFPGLEKKFDENPRESQAHKEYRVTRWETTKHALYELEPGQESAHADDLTQQLESLQRAKDLDELLETAAELVMHELDLSRVMIYKFHEDLHGEVVAEKVKKGVDSFMGLHYPSTDIPAPARALFLEKWVRVISDVNAVGVNVEPKGHSLDLTPSSLRQPSPIHVEYLKNMEVAASVTISLIVEGKLWGLIACHNNRPYVLPPAKRNRCEILGRMVSTHINEAQRVEELSEKDKIRDVHRQLVAKITVCEDMAEELTKVKPTLLDLINADAFLRPSTLKAVG